MRRRFLFALELTIVVALVLVTRCANYRDVFAGGRIYFIDADCYSRMTRARICFEHPGTIIRHHDFENFPQGTSPHTTAPFDYLIVALAALLAPLTRNALDLAGAIVSPLIAVALGIFFCWWARRIKLRLHFALLGLYAFSPILAHGTALGRPDHQSLLIGLIAVAICAEWMLTHLEGRAPRDGAVPLSSALQRSTRMWSVIAGASWGMGLWVSVYEPLLLLGIVLLVRAVRRMRTGQTPGSHRVWWIAFLGIVVLAALIERRIPQSPVPNSFAALQNWSATIGELARVPLNSRLWFEWCGWLILLAPILFWPRQGNRIPPRSLVALLVATFALTMMQARWGYFFALVFAITAPEILGIFRKPMLAGAIFFVSLFPIARAWDRAFSQSEWTAKSERRTEQIEARALATEIDGPFLAPWWISPSLSYWSRQPSVGGSSHESLSGIVDSARFYATFQPEEASAICAARQVQWIISYDAERLAENAGRILGMSVSPHAICFSLDRHPSAVSPFLKLVRQTARFKLYEVARR